MSQFSFDNLIKQDFWSALKLWLVLEVFSFLIFPVIGMIQPGVRLRSWFLISLPLGIGGALLVGFSSRFVAITNERYRSRAKTIELSAGQALGWLGLLGVAFPLLMVSLEFLSKLSREIQQLPIG